MNEQLSTIATGCSRGCLGWIFLSIASFNGLFFILSLVGLITFSENKQDVTFATVFFSIITAIFGYLAWFFLRKPSSELADEQKVLAVAQASGGKVTVAEIALRCGFKIEKSQLLLDKLAKQGVVEVWITKSGEKVYAFPGLIEEEKHSANDPLDLDYDLKKAEKENDK